MRQLGTIYEETRGRITEVVLGVGPDAYATQVPACPEWSVRDLLAHVTGNCADVVAGNIDGVATPQWTARQVEARRDRSVAEILEEWQNVAPQVALLLDDFPGRTGQMMVADAVSHEHDLRATLGRPGARDSTAVRVALDFLVSVFVHTGTAALGLPPLEVRAGERRWVAGTGGPAMGDLEAWRNELFPDDLTANANVVPRGSVSGEPFELMRAVAGRRSPAQIRTFDWSVDPEPYIPVFGFGPFGLPSSDVDE